MFFKNRKIFIILGILFSLIPCYWIYNSVYFFLISKNAEQFIQKGNFEKAFQLYQSLQKNYPKDPFVTKKLGDILTVKEAYTEAIQYYEKSLQIANNSKISSDIHHNLGNVLFKIGSFTEATQQYKESLRLRSTDETKWNLELSLRNPSLTPPTPKDSSSEKDSNQQQSLQKPQISQSEAETILQSMGEKSEKKDAKMKSILPLSDGVFLDKNW